MDGKTTDWSQRLESNPQPADYKSAALPIVLRQQFEEYEIEFQSLLIFLECQCIPSIDNSSLNKLIVLMLLLVQKMRLELIRYHYRGILSPMCLPISPLLDLLAGEVRFELTQCWNQNPVPQTAWLLPNNAALTEQVERLFAPYWYLAQ